MSGFKKVLILLIGIVNLGASGYFCLRIYQLVKTLPEIPREVAAKGPAVEVDEHGNPIAPKPVDPNADKMRSWVTLDEMYVNVFSDGSDEAHTLSFKLDIELFEESSRHVMEERQGMIKNALIEVARKQPFDSLTTLGGKLYFKEALVEQVNEAVRFPLIRDVHLASFSLR